MSDKLCIFGEVLFDHFPDGKRVLGGAPFNVAWHLQAFGKAPYFISRVGNDGEGETIRQAMHDWGMRTDGLQTDPHHPTGRVSIEFENGEPVYDIVKPCAYDAIEPTAVASTTCQMLYHGSLALRDALSRKSAEQLRTSNHETLFVDVNLRPPWWQREQVLQMVHAADWVKLNHEELALLTPTAEGDVAAARSLLAEYRLTGVVLTRGSHGAELLTAAGDHYHVAPQSGIKVVDTVGAGDAFASVMILGLSNHWPLALTLQRAQAFASAIVGQRGATTADRAFYRDFIANWQLNG